MNVRWLYRIPPLLRRLQVQLVLWVILPLLSLLFVVAFIGIRSHQQSMRMLVLERDQGLARLLAGNISTLLNRYTGRFQLVAASATPETLPQLREQLAENNIPPEEIVLVLVDRSSRVRAAVPWPFAFSFLPVPGQAISTAYVNHVAYVLWWLPRQDGWFVAGIPQERLPIAQLIQAEYRSQAGYVALFDTYGRLVASTQWDPSPPFEAWSHLYALVSQESDVFYHTTPMGELVIAYVRVPGTQWTVILQESWSALLAPLPQLSRILPFILGATVIISVLALFFGLRYVSLPLRRLSHMAERIGQGDFTAAAQPVGGVEEIEELRRALHRMAQQVRQYQAAQRHYLHLLARAQEEERTRLAREIHDDTVQTLIAVVQQIQLARRALATDPQQADARLARLQSTVVQAVENLRRLIRDLRPLYLEEVGLISALEMLAREAGAQFQVQGTPRRLPPDVELALFRIAQEALNNARRHAQASKITLTLTFTSSHIRLDVWDNGVGFQVPRELTALVQAGHLGLMNMVERAQSVGAHLHIHSAPGRGTRITVELPPPLERDTSPGEGGAPAK